MRQAHLLHPDLTPKFSPSPKAISEYRSVFGPFFPIKNVTFPGSGPEEHRAGVGRLNALRKPETPGFSDMLTTNQSRVFRAIRSSHQHFEEHFWSHYHPLLPEEQYPAWLFQPHAKRKLRLRTQAEVAQYGNAGDDNKPVGFKLKPGELLAPGKKRGIGDLGCLRTDATAYVMEDIKDAWSVPFRNRNLTATYVKRSTDTDLVHTFESLQNPVGIQFFYHSDDSCVAAHCRDGLFMGNGDVKQCDGSHRTAMFASLERLLTKRMGVETPQAHAIHRAFKYLRSPMEFRNRNNRREKIRYKYTHTRLYSGSVLTTTVNNYANLLIALCLGRLVPEPLAVSKAEFQRAYEAAGVMAGYQLKMQVCDTVEELQFLKHSYCPINRGVYMNLGTWFRGFGTFSGDLPGHGAFAERARVFVSEVVRGRSTWGKHIISEGMSGLISNRRMTETEERRYASFLNDDRNKCLSASPSTIDISTLTRRYKCSPSELVTLGKVLRGLDVYHVCSNPLVQRFYDVDYG